MTSYEIYLDDNPCSTASFTCTYTGYILSFETNGGSAVDSVSAAVDTVINDFSTYTTTRDGYTFTGWYEDAALTKPVTSITLTEDKTVYAGWEEIPNYTKTTE